MFLHPQGYQVNTHAIGDRANRLVLDAYQNATASLCQERRRCQANDLRLQIEHAQVLVRWRGSPKAVPPKIS